MITSFKVKLEPNNKQLTKFNQSAGVARYIYNWTLNRQQENYKNGGKFISDNILRKELTQLKKTNLQWLSNVSSKVTAQAVKDACDAYKKFFKKLSDRPKFKSKKKSKISFYNPNDKINFTSTHVQLEKIGFVKLSQYNRIPITNKYMNPRITSDKLHWYISVSIEVNPTVEQLTGESIGIDLGIKDLAIVSNFTKPFKNINKSKSIKKKEKKLRRLQRKVSNKYRLNKKGGSYVKTSNIIKLEYKIRKLHKRLDNVRTDYIHKVTTEIVKTKPSRIVTETLNIKGMMKNKHLSKSINMQRFNEFTKTIEYKAINYGIEFVKASMWFASSKTCSSCGFKKPKLSLSERTFICEDCGSVIDRDINASINLSRYKVS